MVALSNSKLFNSPKMDSHIKSANMQRGEKWLGYFAAPSIIMCMFAMCGQSYLNVFYTDVLKMSSIGGGLFLALLPVISKIIDAITNLIMGQIVERTRCRQGKARPWILISGPLLAISGILLFTVPTGSISTQVIWVTVSYNLYFCLAFTMYNISHTLMVPLSTRNGRQRDVLAMFTSMGTSMIPGVIVSMLFPTNMGIVLGGLALRSFGALPITYILMSMLADALDHVEWLNGFRCDGFSSSVYSIILTVTVGISTGVFNAFLGMVNYVPPLADGSFVTQAGYGKTFGLIAVDRKTQTRCTKESLNILGSLREKAL